MQRVRKKEAKKLGKIGEGMKMAGRGGPPVAPPKKLQLQLPKENFPGLSVASR